MFIFFSIRFYFIAFLVFRYRVSVEVTDGECSLEFVLFGSVAEFAIGAAAAQVLANEDLSSDEGPAELLNLVGKRFLFSTTFARKRSYPDHTMFSISRVDPVPADAPVLSLPALEPPSVPTQNVANLVALSSSGVSSKSPVEKASACTSSMSAEKLRKKDLAIEDDFEIVDTGSRTPPGDVTTVDPSVETKRYNLLFFPF